MESLEDSADEPSANYSSVEIQDIIGVQKTPERKELEYHLRNNNLEKVRKKFSKYKEIFESDTESLEDPAHEPSANYSSVEIQDTIGVQKTTEREEPEYQLQNNNLEKLRKKFSKHTKIFESDTENSEQDLEDESSTEYGGTRRNTECERKEIDGDDYSKIILNDSVVIKRSIKNCGQIINVEHEEKNNDSEEEIVEQRHVTPIKKRINGKCRKNKKKSECLKGDKALKNKELVVRITPVKTDKLRLYEEASSRQDKSKGGNIIQRRTWDTPERYTARKLFNWYIANEQMPSYFQCENAVKTEPALAGRTTQQLYTWIHNQIKATHYKSDRVKQTWSTPEKRVIRNIFKKYIEKESGPYPNYIECQEAIMKYPELRGRTVAKIKSFIQHQRLLFNKKNKQS